MENDKIRIQWFPGHMTKADVYKRQGLLKPKERLELSRQITSMTEFTEEA